MPAQLSTHVLDTAHGCPADAMTIEVWASDSSPPRLLKTVCTDADGRTDAPLLSAGEMKAGAYELVFYVSDYFASKGTALTKPPFLGRVPVRFSISDPSASYHVPLLVSPWAYST